MGLIWPMGTDVGMSRAQVWDTPAIRLEKVRYLLPRRKCLCCQKTTTAAVPFGQTGAVTYGPNVNAAAILLGSAGNVPVERTAMLMAALLGSPVSTGFVSRAHERFAQRLEAAGFDDAMSSALADEPVLCGDETPVNIAHKDTDEDGTPVPGAPHVVTVRTPEGRLVSYRALPARTKVALRDLGVLKDCPGCIVRDDYVGWHQFDERAAGVQQCVSHLFRHLRSVLDLHPDQQAWAGEARDVLREAHTAVAAAKVAEAQALDPALLGDLRARYDKAVTWGQATNRHRDRDGTGNHPGYTLAKRLADKVDQVWLFTTAFSVPWTNNCSRAGPEKPQTTPESLRLLAHPDHLGQVLHRALLPHQRLQPRPPRHPRHPQRPHRQPLDATHHRLTIKINSSQPREWTRCQRVGVRRKRPGRRMIASSGWLAGVPRPGTSVLIRWPTPDVL